MDKRRRLGFQSLPEGARAIWAKSGEGAGHGLLAHLLDVAAVAQAVLQREPAATLQWMAKALGLDPGRVGRWVAAVVGLHDLGKATPGFQCKWLEGRVLDEQQGLPFHPAALSCDRHSLATTALLPDLLQRLSHAAGPWCAQVAQAVGAHHGYHFQSGERDAGTSRHEGRPWAEAREAILQAYWGTLAPQGVPGVHSLGLPEVNWLAGLTSAADWIASNPEWLPPGERAEFLDDHFDCALRCAHDALDHIGWTRHRTLLDGRPFLDDLLARIVGRGGLQPRALQCAGDDLLQSAHGPALLLVEAPMGEGKTELAFLAHLRLQAANHHRGLYVALPTQATGNALFKRAQTFLSAFAPGPLDVQLVHGGAAMNADLAALRDIDHSRKETLASGAWFGQRRRPLLSPYGVGTVDQALYAVLNVKHHFVRLWGLSNRVVVLDEVHAYDTYTLGLITTLLRWLKALGCSVVLMSATLPRKRCRELLQAWGVDAPPELAYPRLLLADDAGVRGRHVAARDMPPIALSGVGSGIDALADAAFAALAGGGCGAVIVNTVGRAQTLFLALKARLADDPADATLLLFHARFPADERGAIEQRVLSLFGPHAVRPRRALLVATQVAEQSLDIDFDFMLSDLAPVDLLLQRAGRLHRHERPDRPPVHAQARLLVAGLLPGQLPEMKQTGWSHVYDAYILGRTWALLTRESVLHLPHDIDRLVQAVYDVEHELPAGLEAAARRFIEEQSFGDYLASAQRQRTQAFHIALHPAAEPQVAYDGKPRGHEEDELGLGLENTTRLGPESVTLVPVLVGTDGLWRVQPGDAGFESGQVPDGATARALYNRQVKVSRKAVVKHFQAIARPKSFADHALLGHMYPLCLVDGVAVGPGPKLALSPELGLVLSESESDVPKGGK